MPGRHILTKKTNSDAMKSMRTFEKLVVFH